MTRIFLGSGGFRTGRRLKFLRRELNRFLGNRSQVLVIPYAIADSHAVLQAIRKLKFFGSREIQGIHEFKDPFQAIRQAKAIYVNGGNTFRLVNALQKKGLLNAIRARINKGTPYVGISAGANVAGPSMKTTNDMPVIQPTSFGALGLVPFQINPHFFPGRVYYRFKNRYVPYAGETRIDRIREFHETNDVPVIGLPEGTALVIQDRKITYKGAEGMDAVIFRRGEEPKNMPTGKNLASYLLRTNRTRTAR